MTQQPQPYKRQSGDELTAELWNSVMDRLAELSSGDGLQQKQMSRVEVRVQNNTGADREIGETVEIKNYDGLDTGDIHDIPGNIVLTVETPTRLSRRERLCILAEPIPAGDIGLAVVDGICIAALNYQSGNHNRLGLNADDFHIGRTVAAGGYASIIDFLPVPGAGDPTHAIVSIPVYSRPFIRWVSTQKISDRTFLGEIEYVDGNVINPATGAPYQQLNEPSNRGDIVAIHDAANLFPEIESGSIGTAWFNREYERWEVVTSSRPVDIVWARLKDCLLSTDITGTAIFGVSSNPAQADWQVSGHPATDFPPEARTIAPGSFELDFSNPCKLHGLRDANVLLRRRQVKPDSDPFQQITPLAQSATGPYWVLESVCKPFARFGLFEYNEGSDWNPVRFWDGEDPDQAPSGGCPYQTSCMFDCSCLEDGEQILAVYNNLTNTYEGIATASALMGTPQTIGYLSPSPSINGCTITFPQSTHKGWPCDPSASQSSVTLPTTVINSVNSLYYGGEGRICIDMSSFAVVACGPAQAPAAQCVDICAILCDCEEIYSLPDVCQPPPPPNCNCCECYFEQGATGLQIHWTSASDESYGTLDVTPTSNDCEWLAVFTDALGGPDRTWTIQYLCDGRWRAFGAWPGTISNGTPMDLVGVGSCGGAVLDGSGGANVPPDADGSVTADGTDICDEISGCCETWSGDEYLNRFIGLNFDDFSARIPDGVYGLKDGGNGNCAKYATAPCTITDEALDEECDTELKIELWYDRDINGQIGDDGCRWHYELPPCTFPGGSEFPGDAGAVFGCLGGQCQDAKGTCEGFADVELSIVDPDNSVTQCTDPDAAP